MKNTRVLILIVFIVVVGAAVVAVVVPSIISQQGTSEEVAGNEDNGRIAVLRLINEGFVEGNSDVVNEIFAPDYVGHIPANPIIDSRLDVNKMIELIELVGSAFPDLQIESDFLIQDGNIVGNRAIIRGNFLSEFYDVPPTESSIEFAVNVFHRFNDEGKIVEEWIEFDTWDVLQQLGIDPLSN
jgi:predicted ester cyclase